MIRTNVLRRRLAPAALGIVFIAAAGCQDRLPTGTTESGDVPLRVTASVVGTPIATLVVTVTASDIATPLTFNLTVANGVASGTIKVPPGLARTITVTAFDDQGNVTHDGSVTIDVKPGQNPPVQIHLVPRSGQVPVTVTFGSYGVVVTPASATIAVGQQLQLTVAVTDAYGQAVSNPAVAWATSQPTVAAVSAGGLVSGQAAGTVTIEATCEGVPGHSTVAVMAFRLTSGLHSETEDLGAAVVAEFGSGYRLADWVDVVAAAAGHAAAWADSIGLPDQGAALVSSGGQRFYSGWRQFYIQRFNNRTPPSGFLVFDQIDGGVIVLGSWAGLQMPILAVRIPAAAPKVTGISPAIGPQSGGTSVTITGTGFAVATAVTVGGKALIGWQVVSATQITGTTPTGGAPGSADVVVTTAAGTGTCRGCFIYLVPSGSAQFRLTSGLHSETEDLNAAVVAELGPAYRLADWNDVTAAAEGHAAAWADSVGLTDQTSALVSSGGQRFYAGWRQYFIQRFNSKTPPSGFLVFAQVDGGLIVLGSWVGLEMPILAVRQ